MSTRFISRKTDRVLARPAYVSFIATLLFLVSACATTNHRHTRAAIFVGLQSLNDGTLKGFQEPRFIHLDGEDEITWILKAPAGSNARITGLDFMMDPRGSTDFSDGSVTVSAGTPVTLKLRDDADDPVYEYRITISQGGVDYPVNYPPKVIP